MRHNLGQYHQDQHILLTHYCDYPIQGFLLSSSNRITELHFFSDQNIFLIYVMVFGHADDLAARHKQYLMIIR